MIKEALINFFFFLKISDVNQSGEIDTKDFELAIEVRFFFRFHINRKVKYKNHIMYNPKKKSSYIFFSYRKIFHFGFENINQLNKSFIVFCYGFRMNENILFFIFFIRKFVH